MPKSLEGIKKAEEEVRKITEKLRQELNSETRITVLQRLPHEIPSPHSSAHD
ncbi:hypothetical protein OP10G_3823 [Fimbriimonas ginsengisoli Gsoil 348]|uniref:Uncharacterized protein n=1 Tax=Fimbriimonas ginsengisoli Gsoil 348 TaxID=661478 RepID=A0A068NUS1_FIMGI|nr:hypothetical protein OP10G_3823 [Fimbriimonas ginsengisoli Gsoil 348]